MWQDADADAGRGGCCVKQEAHVARASRGGAVVRHTKRKRSKQQYQKMTFELSHDHEEPMETRRHAMSHVEEAHAVMLWSTVHGDATFCEIPAWDGGTTPERTFAALQDFCHL